MQASVGGAIERLRQEVPGANVTGVAADLGLLAGVQLLIAAAPKTDILVNNLGIFEPQPFFEITDDQWEHYFAVNVMSAVRLSRHYAPEMVRQGWGRILFNASVTGGFFSGEMVHYGATKAALIGLSRGLAESLGGSRVTVNAFIPGPTLTERSHDFMDKAAQSAGKSLQQMEAELFTTSLPTSLLQRFIQPAEVANLVVFLASEHASALTGAALRVDGGIVRSLP
jgi:NAD(P)-dependent dehydrogenase (short-subunit alcohol dehydrogenase family)